jgi:hypothetical protein
MIWGGKSKPQRLTSPRSHVRAGPLYMTKKQKGCEHPGFGPVLGFEEGDERGPFFGSEPSQSLGF